MIPSRALSGTTAIAPAPPSAPRSPTAARDEDLTLTSSGRSAASLIPRQEKRASAPVAAFFDVDNTIVQGASLFYLARGLYQRDFFTFRDLIGFARENLSFWMRGESAVDISGIQQRALGFVRGHEVTRMRQMGAEIFDDLMAHKIWPGTLAHIQRHQKEGHQVYLVTASPQDVADVIAERLQIAGAIGTRTQQQDGVYTGELSGPIMHGQAKADVIAQMAAEHDYDLAQCWAYSDSVNDLPMLNLVGNPYCINPDASLAGHARIQGWPVEDFRRARNAAKAALPTAAGFVAGAATMWLWRRK